jgi:hypothetical protein
MRERNPSKSLQRLGCFVKPRYNGKENMAKAVS